MAIKKKPAAKKSTTKKSPAAKAATKVTKVVSKKPSRPSKTSTKATPIPKGREHQLAEKALSLVDQAAAVLRSGIREGAQTTAKSRIAAKKKANDLLGKASTNLNKAIGDSTSALQNLLGKL
jgi:hypothetical protein